MVFNPQTKGTNLQTAYNSLADADKSRIKTSILTICEISESTFYQWLKTPALIRKSDRFQIANLFGIEPNQLFNPKNQ